MVTVIRKSGRTSALPNVRLGFTRCQPPKSRQRDKSERERRDDGDDQPRGDIIDAAVRVCTHQLAVR